MQKISIKSKEALDSARRILEAGGVVIVPTDTVYGLTADIGNEEAIRKIYEIKKRDPENRLGIFAKDAAMVKDYAEVEDALLEKLFQIWPRPLTAVLFSKKSGTIGIRVPKDDFLMELLGILSRPLVQTSANISGHPDHTTLADVLDELGREAAIDLVIDGGDLSPGQMASTGVDFTKEEPVIFRKGPVGREELELIFGVPFQDAEESAK